MGYIPDKFAGWSPYFIVMGYATLVGAKFFIRAAGNLSATLIADFCCNRGHLEGFY